MYGLLGVKQRDMSRQLCACWGLGGGGRRAFDEKWAEGSDGRGEIVIIFGGGYPPKIEERRGVGVDWKKLCRDSGVEPQG